MSNYCRTCEREVRRCWGNGLCSGGGHCDDCMGYDFADQDDETEEQIEMREANETLTEVLENEHEQNSN